MPLASLHQAGRGGAGLQLIQLSASKRQPEALAALRLVWPGDELLVVLHDVDNPGSTTAMRLNADVAPVRPAGLAVTPLFALSCHDVPLPQQHDADAARVAPRRARVCVCMRRWWPASAWAPRCSS